jgi:flagellar basal-body rod protein FlgF
MTYGLYMSAMGAQAQSRRIEVLSHNLANVDSQGFKRELSVQRARSSAAIEQKKDYPYTTSINRVGGGTFTGETVTDFSVGPLRATGNRADLAIRGEGFFVTEKNGTEYLTRDGALTVDNAGVLKTQGGYSVLSEDGSPILITDPNFSISEAGIVQQNGGATPIALVRPRFPADLAKASDNHYRALSPPVAIPAEQRKVASGFLEGSNVKSTTEMMTLIEASRAYESNVRMIQHQDQTASTLISRILRTN